MSSIRVGLLGCGTVGTGVIRLLQENAPGIGARLGSPIEVTRIAVRDLDRERDPVVPRDRLTVDPNEILDDPDVHVVVEVMGGLEPARSLAKAALERGKHLVTANKALMARHGLELSSAAGAGGADVHFEAAVGGGIPIIRSLRESLASDRIDQIAAIINGTSNFVLTAMTEEGWSFDDAVKEAQKLGYAEADPTLDVGGYDAAQKLAILVALGFGVRVTDEAIPVQGLSAVTPVDIELADGFGYGIRPLALARGTAAGVQAWVSPALVPHGGQMAPVRGVFNAVHIHSFALGSTLLSGQGAGMMPTAVSVVSDIIEAARNVVSGTSGRLPHLAFHDLAAPAGESTPIARVISPPGEATKAYYLRFGVKDEPGVLAQLAACFGSHGVSLRQLVQAEPDETGHTTLALLTHTARESAVRTALEAVSGLDAVTGETVAMPVVEI